jgi:hypothetical protein
LKSLCIYTTALEPILAKMSDADERLRAAAKRRLRLKQSFLYNSFLPPPFFFLWERESLLSAFCSKRAGGGALMFPLGRGGIPLTPPSAAPSLGLTGFGRTKSYKLKVLESGVSSVEFVFSSVSVVPL